MSVIPRKMGPHKVRRNGKSQCDSKFTTPSKFTTHSIFSTVGSFDTFPPPLFGDSLSIPLTGKRHRPDQPQFLRTPKVVLESTLRSTWTGKETLKIPEKYDSRISGGISGGI